MKYAASNTADDTLISTLILACDSRVQSILDRNLESTAYSNERYDGNGTDELLLKHFPIISVSEVKVSADYSFSAVSALVEDDEFTIEANTGTLFRLGGVWEVGKRNIRVSYTGGYATLPSDVVHAANMTVAEWVQRAKQLEGGQTQSPITSEDIGGERTTDYAWEVAKTADIPKAAMDIFLRYRYLC